MEDRQFECPNCGRPLFRDDNLKGYICIDCNECFNFSEITQEEESEEKKIPNEYDGKYVEIQCKLCGKNTIVDKNYSYDVCPFCYNNLIDFSDEIKGFTPEVIIQFAETPTSFGSHLIDTLKADGCPTELIAGAKIDSLKGVYIPFNRFMVENTYRCFLETCENDSKYGSEYYYQEISYVENLNVLCDSTSLIPNNAIDDFANYDIKKAKAYDPQMLGEGYFALNNSATQNEIWKALKEIVKNYTEKNMNKYVGKAEEIKKMMLHNIVKNLLKRIILLPVWIIETEYQGETHYIYINGQTNKVASDVDYPKEYKKTMFGKEKVEKYQVQFVDEAKIIYKRFNSGIDYHNAVRKYNSNTTERDQEIGAMRTK